MDENQPTSSPRQYKRYVLKVAPACLALFALLLGWQGQRLFDRQHLSTLPHGMIYFCLAVLSLLLARLIYHWSHYALPSWWFKGESLAKEDSPSAKEPTLASTISYLPWRLGATLLALLILVTILVSLSGIDHNDASLSFTGYFWAWVMACTLVVGAWWIPFPNWSAWPERMTRFLLLHRWEMIVLLLITLLGGWLRLNHLADAPFTINGDEGSIGLEVMRVVKGELKNPFTLIWGPLPSLYAFVLAVPMRLFGPSIQVLRFSSALIGTLAIPALFVLARVMNRSSKGRSIALTAALFLATFPMHIHYSRIEVGGSIWDTVLFTAALAAFWYGIQQEKDKIWPFVVAALCAGLDQYAYTGSRLLPLLLLLFAFYLALFDQNRLKDKTIGLLIMILLFCVISGPIYLHGYYYPDEFNARINQTGILQTGWLDAEAELRGESRLSILGDQFRRALFGFAYLSDRAETWGPNSPLAPPLLSLGLFLGLFLSLRHWRHSAIIMLQGWFWGVILTAGMLTLHPPTSNRLVVITPVVCLFAAIGWQMMAQALAPLFLFSFEQQHAKATTWGVLALLAGLTALSGVRAHTAYLADNNYGGGNAFVATQIGYDLAEQATDTTLIMLGAPRIYSDISPLLFLTPDYARQDIYDILNAPPTDLPANTRLMFAVLPERASDLVFIQQAFPNGQLKERRAENRDDVLYYQVIVEK